MIFHTYLKRILFLILFIGSLAASHAQGLYLEDGHNQEAFQGQYPIYRITVEIEMGSRYSFRIFDGSTGEYIFDGFSFVPSENSGIIEEFMEMRSGGYWFENIYEATKYCIKVDMTGKKVELGKHELIYEETPATCVTPGYKYGTCESCGGEEVIESSPILYHDFPTAWEDATDGKHSKTCQRAGCGVSIYSYDANGEPMLSIGLWDGSVMAYPQSTNPKYVCEESNGKFTSTDGELVLPNVMVKSMATAWPHKMQTTQDAENGSWTMKCLAENCTHDAKRWVNINGEEKNATSLTGDLAVAELDITDGSGYDTDATFKANKATYTRQMTGWNTLCLPFEIDMSNTSNKNYQLYTLCSATEDAIVLEEQKGKVAAGTPLIVKLNDGETTLNIAEEEAMTAPKVLPGSTTEGNEYQLVGTYAEKQFTPTDNFDDFVLLKGLWWNVGKLLENEKNKTVNSKPYRAYVTKLSQSNNAKQLRMVVKGETTAVDSLNAITSDNKAEYYDMQGRRINALQKGINIVKNGNTTRKIIIK